MFFKGWFVLFQVTVAGYVATQEVSDKDYVSMPDLFHLDDYDKCMLLEHEALYCTFTFHLRPLEPNTNSFVWNIIQNISSDPRNYHHDLLRYGSCVPISCPNSTGTLQTIQDCYDKKFAYMGLRGNVTDLKCQTKEHPHRVDVYDIVVGICFLTYFIFVVFASIYEGVARYKKKEVYDKVTGTCAGTILSAFSIPRNWHRLTAPNTDPDARKLRSIQGIRVYNLMCVIMCHTLMITFSLPVSNPKFVENLTNDTLNMFVANGNYAVQTFFVISGWLLCFHWFRSFEDGKSLKFSHLVLAFVNRYMRLTPVLAVTIAFESTWLMHIGRGPNWDQAVGEDYRNCRRNWWTNLLYVNNYVDKDNMCLHQSWYIASDTQLYFFSLLLLWFLWHNQKIIKVVLGGIIVGGLLLQGGLAYVRNYDITVRQYPEALYALRGLRVKEWHTMYSSGYSNIVGYTIGLAFGYAFYKYRNKVLLITKFHVTLWWLLTFGVCNFVVLIASKVYEPDFVNTPIKSAIYWAFGKNLFAFGIGLGIFGFSRKIGWFARWFTEWQSVTILGRLTYSTYIIHVTLIRVRGGLQRQPYYLNEYLLLSYVLGDIALSYLIGTLVCLLFEMPISALQKLLVPQIKGNTKRSLEKSLKTLDCEECEEERNLSKN